MMIDVQQSRSGNSWCTGWATGGSTSWATRGFTCCATGGPTWSGLDNDGRKVPSSGMNRRMIYGCKCLASAGIIAARATCVFETGRRSRSRWKYRHVSHRVKARRRWHNAIVLARSEMKCAHGRARSRYIFFSRSALAHTWHDAKKPGVRRVRFQRFALTIIASHPMFMSFERVAGFAYWAISVTEPLTVVSYRKKIKNKWSKRV